MYAKQSIKNLTMEKLLDLVYSSGLVRLGHPFLSRFLTVVNYHRIHDITPSFDSFRPNVSATTSMFEEQMKYRFWNFTTWKPLQLIHSDIN
mgnify:CR=1 FL=1